MPATLTATLDPGNWPPRVLLQVSGADGTAVTITRYNADGTNYVVREADADPLVGGALVCYDYDAPHAQAATYFATTDGTTNASVAVASLRSVGVMRPWLIHPGLPSLSMPITVARRGSRTRAVNRGRQDVVSRADAIFASDGQRKSPTFDLVIRTSSLADDQRLLDLLDDSSTLLLQLGYPDTDRVYYGWVSIGDTEESDVVEWMGSEALETTLPCEQTSRPIGKQQAQRTYGDVLAENTDYAAVLRAYSTYQALLLGNRSS